MQLLLFLVGPGCSSIAYGEAEEIGPFHIKPDGKTLFRNPYSWNQGESITTILQSTDYNNFFFILIFHSFIINAIMSNFSNCAVL